MDAGPWRLFVALELPPAVRETLAAWQAGWAPRVAGVRPVAPESMHVTLCFLGMRPAAEVEAVGQACRSISGAGAVALELGRLESLGFRGSVLAVRVVDENGALGTIQARLSDALVAIGAYAGERRRFRAHVTVARVAEGGRVGRDQVPPPPQPQFSGDRVTLFRSRLGRGPAVYEPLHSVSLARA